MKRRYVLINCLRILIKILMFGTLIFLLAFIYRQLNKQGNSYSSMPQITAWFYLLFYIPIASVGIWGLIKTKKILKILNPEKYSKVRPITRQKILKILGKIAVRVFLYIIIILILFPFGTIFLVTQHHVYYREDSLLQMLYAANDYGLTENIVSIKTEDRFNLWVSEIEVECPKGIVIYLSGIEQPSVTQFYAHAKLMKENGYASFLVEVRGHGRSDGDEVCLGYDEILDVKAVIEYIKNKEEYTDVPIVLHGVSMGGAIAVNAFGQYKEIDALIAMSAYSSFEDEVVSMMKKNGVPDFICKIEKPILKLALKEKFGSYKVNTINPVTQIKNSNGRSVFLIAAKGDSNVPIDNLYRLNAVCNDADIWIKNSWEHFIVNDCDLANIKEDLEYCSKILEFLDKVNKKHKTQKKDGAF